MTRMTPSEAFVETLVANEVTTMFGIMGSAFMDAMDIFAPAGITMIPVVHEQGAAHMADGYARVSGKHGVCIGQNGPGISNCVTAIAAAYWAHSPVVIVTPESGTMGMGLGGFQEGNQLPMFQEFTKYQGHVNNPRRMAEYTGRCFDRAMSEMGPTQLNIPRDYFYGDIECEIRQPSRLDRGPGGETSLNAAADLLATAKNPVIISGGGVVMADGVEECKALAERLGAPVVNSYLHNDSFPASHPLWCGPLGYQGSKAAMKLISGADVVLALGSRLGPFGTLPQYGMEYWPADAKIIQVDADHKMLGLVKNISVGICGDAAASAKALLARINDRSLVCDGTRDQRAAGIKTEKDAWEKELDEWTHETDQYSLDMIEEQNNEDGNWMHPRQVLRELEKHMPKDVMVSTDIGNINSVANSYLRFERPTQFLCPHELGKLRLRVPDHDRRQGGRARPPGHLVRRRRRLGHEHVGSHDLRPSQHPRYRRCLPQSTVGCGEEKPGGLLQPQVRRRRTRQSELRRHWPRHGCGRHHHRQAGRRRAGAGESHRHADERRQDDRARIHVYTGTGRPLPPGCPEHPGAVSGKIQGLRINRIL